MNETSSKCDVSEKPADEMPCNYGECNSDFFWRTGNWSAVNQSSLLLIKYLKLKLRIIKSVHRVAVSGIRNELFNA